MTQQEELFFDDIYGALGHLVAAAGGAKVVGAKLWPALPIEASRDRLMACLKRDRRETLDPEELIRLLRLGRDAGAHGAMRWLAVEAGYEARPVTPREQLSTAQREYVDAVRTLSRITERIERLQGRDA